MNLFSMLVLPILLLATSACGGSSAAEPHAAHSEKEMTGAHGGRLLQTDGLSVEVTIFETGVPPEFRLYVLADGKPVDPTQLDLHITLTRLGGNTDEIAFVAEDDYFRGDTEIYEPHSFAVEVTARYQGKQHQWHYDSFEGRTRISAQMARNTGLGIETAGPATIRDYVSVYGQVVSHPENVSHVVARFDGVIQAVHASIGDQVTAGEVLATIEANDSLNNYDITSPITGTLVERHANRGEATAGRTLFTLIDTRTVWAELAVFPSDRPRIQIGAPVKIRTAIGNLEANGNISLLSPVLTANQAATARVPLANPDGLLIAGMYLTGEIEVARAEVPLAVRRSALQPFRDFTVVFAQFGDEYEVRMLDLGRQDDEWAEVLGGLRPGTRYVTDNSYILKADVEKSGASHDH